MARKIAAVMLQLELKLAAVQMRGVWLLLLYGWEERLAVQHV